jgi:starch phosphorylase
MSKRKTSGDIDYSIFFTDRKSGDTYSLENQLAEHLEMSLVKDRFTVSKRDAYNALALSIRDRLIRRWLRTQHKYRVHDTKRVYYLSLEFLMGRLLGNALINLGDYDECSRILESLGYSLEEIREVEHDMGLGNGGLGRLAACFLDSMATMNFPAFGYGIRYEYGIFEQSFENGYQVELPDNWLTYINPWEVIRPNLTYRVRYGGRVEQKPDANGNMTYRWVDTDDVLAVAYDIPIPGYHTDTVNNLRLWQAKSTHDFDFKTFHSGDYMASVRKKNMSEVISKVLYPNDDNYSGKLLRLKQQYFFVSATVHDIIRKFRTQHEELRMLPEKVAIQLNDTHPSIAIPEMMRVLIDNEGMSWDEAWRITRGTFAYTNHTVMSEALEKWPVEMFEALLPRHLQIIYDINHRLIAEVEKKFPSDPARISRMSLVEEGHVKHIRMANLAAYGSHTVNGVANLHTEILKKQIFRDFEALEPGKIINITNGITQRRWLRKADPMLSELITDRIGDGWVKNLGELSKLEPLAEDAVFRDLWDNAKWANKKLLSETMKENVGVVAIDGSMYDVHVKRIHEYKRQLLNALHVITLYNEIKDTPQANITPRTVIFAGKAAPGYQMAKLIIKLINSIASVVNTDPATEGLLRVAFLRNYSVSLAERIIPAADLSEQISTAGTEASGTGNMKLALNGALTIGTLDGANIEIAEEVGRENLFIFGHTEAEIHRMRLSGYTPRKYYDGDPRLARALDMIQNDFFSMREPGIFRPIVESLLHHGDRFFILADYAPYIEAQRQVSELFRNRNEWNRRSILTVSRMGRFSSDRTIAEYAKKIWNVKPD